MTKALHSIVMKFGGTSVGTAARMNLVVELVSSTTKKGMCPIVVLSAMSGVTDLLIEGAEKALKRDLAAALFLVEKIRARHTEAISELFESAQAKANMENSFKEKLEELAILYKGVAYLGELSKRSLDAICCVGELLSSTIVAELAKERGLAAAWLDARKIVITDSNFGRARPLWDKLIPNCRKHIGASLDKNEVVFTQGFVGSTVDGVSTTLGRGGSDYSASIIGVAVNVSEIQIWTDVDGMMSADPRVVDTAHVLSEVSFQEASELAYFGAKVLHPLTIQPAVDKNIPVRILNTLNPDGPGTAIKATITNSDLIRAVASRKNISAVYLSSPNMLMSHGYLSKVFEIFDRYKIAVDLISTSEVSIALTIDSREELDSLEAELSEHACVQIARDVAIVSVIGRQFREQSGIARRVFQALEHIPVLMISGGASDINLSFVVSGTQADQAVRQLHQEFFQS